MYAFQVSLLDDFLVATRRIRLLLRLELLGLMLASRIRRYGWYATGKAAIGNVNLLIEAGVASLERLFFACNNLLTAKPLDVEGPESFLRIDRLPVIC